MKSKDFRGALLSTIRIQVHLIALFVLFYFPLSAQELVVYSGRSKGLVEPIIKQFEKESGVRVRVRYGDTSQLTMALIEEGGKTPADLFWAQDAGALGVLSRRNLLTPLPGSLIDRISPRFRNSAGTWVGTSGRARVLAYAAGRIDTTTLPESIYDLTDPRWMNRIGWAPQNASFQTFVSAMVKRDGSERTLAWLSAVKNNGAKTYRSNVPIIQAIAAGEIDLGLTNHYYLIRYNKADESFPVKQKFYRSGDVGNFVNVAGAGIMQTSSKKDIAARFLEFLLSAKGQQFFTSEVYEYPVTEDVISSPALVPLDDLIDLMPDIDLESLDELDDTLTLLRQAGLL